MKNLHLDSQKALANIASEVPTDARVTFISGNFNILHPGHLRLLRYASECGEYLIIGVNADGHEGVLFSEDLRLIGLTANSWVNYAFVLRDLPEDFIAVLRPTIVVKGPEHENKNNPEQEVLRSYGGKLLFSSGDISFASLDLLREEFRNFNISTIQQPGNYIRRHDFNHLNLYSTLERISSLKVMVLGDLIVDEYITCDALGMSQEDPTIVVTPVMQDRFVGGAGIVAAHARSLGAQVHYISVCGDDDVADFAREQLKKMGVNADLLSDETRPTTLKQRYRADIKTLLRVNHLRQNPISQDLQQCIYEKVLSLLNNVDLVIFSDFNYGCLPNDLIDKIVKACRQHHVMMVADSQSSSQIGDVSRFKHMSVLTPTEREARLALKNFTDGLVVIAENLKRKADAENVLLTLGAEGLLIHASANNDSGFINDRIPALNTAPKDVAGAGDALLTCAAMAMASGASIWQGAYLGSLASACQVGKVGNIPIQLGELRQEIDLLKNLK